MKAIGWRCFLNLDGQICMALEREPLEICSLAHWAFFWAIDHFPITFTCFFTHWDMNSLKTMILFISPYLSQSLWWLAHGGYSVIFMNSINVWMNTWENSHWKKENSPRNSGGYEHKRYELQKTIMVLLSDLKKWKWFPTSSEEIFTC